MNTTDAGLKGTAVTQTVAGSTTIDPKQIQDWYNAVYPSINPTQIQNQPFNWPPSQPKSTGPKMVTRLSIPVQPGNGNTGRGRLEMTCDSPNDRIELTLIMDGKQSIEITVSKKDLEALLGQLTLEKLAK